MARVPYPMVSELENVPRDQLYRNFEEIQRALCPPGMVADFHSVPKVGWLRCDGQAVSRQSYPELFGEIGYAYGGSGDLFNLPDFRGRVRVHQDTGQTEFATVGQTGGDKNGVSSHGHTTNSVDTNHAHNVYARNQDTGWMHANWSHWHGARIGNVGYNFAGHSHNGRPGYAAEAPWEDFRQPGSAVPVNVDATDINHVHNMNHDHPSTNYQSESSWPGTYSHGHTVNANGTTGGNLPPYRVLITCIKT